jgi:hypothetical protein
MKNWMPDQVRHDSIVIEKDKKWQIIQQYTDDIALEKRAW